MSHFLNSIRSKLAETLPGEQAQYLLAPRHRRRIELETLKVEHFRPSAVMILFCEDNEGKLFIPLIERMPYNGAHSAQISLPGGKFDINDEDLEHTATRECFEEIGLGGIKVLGKLTQLFIPVSSFIVHPFVGYCEIKDPVMTVHEREVKTILKLHVDDLLNDKIIEEGEIDLFNNLVIKTPWFNVDGHKVWGATAMILSELKEVLKELRVTNYKLRISET